jgi:hypothetical protein
MLHDPRPDWQANYKSMDPVRLCDELARIAKNPHHFNDACKRRAFIADELALKTSAARGPVILMERE